ncbi:hypothetical protein SNEBB_006629 [Seison nebaliae]|nr:hypothetical protein SNEBB_006629 [Seison nebaliae]
MNLQILPCFKDRKLLREQYCRDCSLKWGSTEEDEYSCRFQFFRICFIAKKDKKRHFFFRTAKQIPENIYSNLIKENFASPSISLARQRSLEENFYILIMIKDFFYSLVMNEFRVSSFTYDGSLVNELDTNQKMFTEHLLELRTEDDSNYIRKKMSLIREVLQTNLAVTSSYWKGNHSSDIRELCDVCCSSIFNLHFFCGNCGLAVCCQCYEMKLKFNRWPGTLGSGVDTYNWPYCILTQLSHDVNDVHRTFLFSPMEMILLLKNLQSILPQLKVENFSSNKLTLVNDELLPSSWIYLPQFQLLSSDNNYIENSYHNDRIERISKLINSVTHISDDISYWNGKNVLIYKNAKSAFPQSFNDPNYKLFRSHWSNGLPIIVRELNDSNKFIDLSLWSSDHLKKKVRRRKVPLIDCSQAEHHVVIKSTDFFWNHFNSYGNFFDVKKPIYKLKDWPTSDDILNYLPENVHNFFQYSPFADYSSRFGNLNLIRSLDEDDVDELDKEMQKEISRTFRVDLGPKLYVATSSFFQWNNGSTVLHLDVSDACNVMLSVKRAPPFIHKHLVAYSLQCIKNDLEQLKSLRKNLRNIGALWHIFKPKDAHRIRHYLIRQKLKYEQLLKRKGQKRNSTKRKCLINLQESERISLDNFPEDWQKQLLLTKHQPGDDPIHDQNIYLNDTMLMELERDYHVHAIPIIQCVGDAIFIPAGAPHQVKNLVNCVKVAEDFLSCELLGNCLKLSQEFRFLSSNHLNHLDKMELFSSIYKSVKSSVSSIMRNNGRKENNNNKKESLNMSKE